MGLILHLAVFIQYRHVTDRQTHDNSIYYVSIASHGKNYNHETHMLGYTFKSGE